MTRHTWDFGVLGPLRLAVDGAEVALGSPKQRAVLAMLLLNRNRAVGVDALIDAVWDASPPPGARAGIHSYVSHLRGVLRRGGPAGQEMLASAPPGYRLEVADADCDLDRFSAARNAGVHAAAAGNFDRASRELKAALAQWRGPVLADLAQFGFVTAFATALEEDRLTAATAYAEAEIACGQAASMIGELERWIADHPYREPLWAQLITAYYLCERQSDALDAFQRVKLMLARDLGIDPGPTLQALHRKILRQEPVDAGGSARTSAVGAATVLEQRTGAGSRPTARLVDAGGCSHPLQAVATRIGRLPDNDIVLTDHRVSRQHAAIIDTGSGFVLTDLRSANGIEVGGVRVRGSVVLSDGDVVGVCDNRFVFRIGPDPAEEVQR